MADALSTSVMNWEVSLLHLVMMMYFITGSKAFLIKVLHVIKSITEIVLTTIESKPLEKVMQYAIDEYSNYLDLLPPPEFQDKIPVILREECPKQSPLKMEKETDKVQNMDIHAQLLTQLSTQIKLMREFQGSFDYLNCEAKETRAQIAELKQSIALIQKLKHENEVLVKTTAQQKKEMEFLKSQISEKTLELPAVKSEIQISQGPETAQIPEVSEVYVPFEKVINEVTNDAFFKIASFVPRFETNDQAIREYLSEVDSYLERSSWLQSRWDLQSGYQPATAQSIGLKPIGTTKCAFDKQVRGPSSIPASRGMPHRDNG